MKAAKRVVKNTGILYARMIVTVFINLYTTRLVLSALGANDFGTFNVIGGAIAMLTFLNSAMANATQRFMSFYEGEGDKDKQLKIFNISQVLHLLIGLIIVVLLEAASFILFDGVLNIPQESIQPAKYIYQFLIVSTLFTVLTAPYDAVLNAHENMSYYAVVSIFDSILRLGIAFFILYTPSDKLIIYGLLMAIKTIVVLIIMAIYCHWKYAECKIAPKKYFDLPLFKEMRSFAGWNFLGSASSMLAGYGANIILNHFHGTIANAANAVASQLKGQLMAFSNTMQKALNPIIAKSEGAGNRNQMIMATLSGSKISFLIFAFLCIPFLFEMPYILSIWLKDIPQWALIFSRLGILFNLTEQITITLGTAIAAVGYIKKYNILTSITILANVIIILIVFYFGYPPYYMPLLSIFVAIIISIIKIVYAQLYCEIRYGLFFKEVVFKIMPVFFISSGLGLIPKFLLEQSLLRLFLVTLSSSICFLILTYYYALNIQERRLITNVKESLVKRLKKR